MSRIGRQQLKIPEKTEVILSDDIILVRGPLGELKRKLRPEIKVEIRDGLVSVNPTEESVLAKALWGTYASHISNMIKGVNHFYEKKLIIEGVGFKAELKGDKLVMNLGFSHPVEIDIPKDLTITVEKNTITVSGIDKELVGQWAAKVRSKKKPEPYKGKGIRYIDEVVRRKQGKKNV
ncbi:MAG: 50S ribosomal protein L6 [Candidatus Pacebacteria bacterium]|nr:50S ribosomal protein L6 [Candidatus Paceibacterota bacterium]